MKKLLKAISVMTALCMLTGAAGTVSAAEATKPAAYENTRKIVLKSTENSDGTYSHTALYDGEEISEYDYTWHADPSESHNEVKNSPAEYYTGTAPGDDAVYIAHDIYYYPELDQSGFKKVNYDGEQEWAYYYTAEGYTDYIFGTLPVSGSSIPTQMMHSEEEAYQNAVLHITEAGTYVIEGDWHGQIWIDLGDTDATFADESAKVKVILNGVDVTCTVAPALVFYSVYECDNTWEDRTSYSKTVDTSDAGANVVIADGTENNFSGTNIYRMLKAKYKDEQSTSDVKVQKKQRKTDGAFYSYVSMNIDGQEQDTGVLNITSGFEGLNSELHLTLNGGNVNIYSQDDGINVNEDGVSVITINGGSLHILSGLGTEGDGIDSNGFLVINGGNVISMANPGSDSGLDSDCGSYINGGNVVALGSTMDWAKADDSSDSKGVTMNLQFASSQKADEAIIITDAEGNVIFAYDPDKDEVAGTKIRNYQGAVVSCEGLKTGESYFVYVGGDVYGDEVSGIYDTATVTGFSDDAKQQCYTGTNVGGMGGNPGGNPGGPGGNPGGGPGDRDGEEPPEKPEGNMSGEEPPEKPEGDMSGEEPPEKPEGDMSGEQPPEKPEGDTGGNGGSTSIYFTMSEKVNDFSGVTDYTGTPIDPQPTESTEPSTEDSKPTEATEPVTEATAPTEVTQPVTEATDPTASPQPSTENTDPADNFKLGDANSDGEINIKDVACIQLFLAKLTSEINLSVCDVNGDGEVNIKDAAYIQLDLAKLL